MDATGKAESHTNPAENDCDSDMLGLIALDDVVMASNTLNVPQRYDVTEPFHTMSATKDEHVHAVILALNQFRAYNPHASPIGGDPGAETCEGVAWGRGCLYLIGGLIQGSWGDLGENGRGYDLRASYNSCVRESAPPQFPATRDFSRKRIVEMNAATFNVANWFADYQS